MAKRATYTEADATALPQAANDAIERYQSEQGKIGINDMLMSFNGSKSALAQELAGTTDKKSTAYKSQMKNIDRWLKGQRDPGRSKATQGKFRKINTQRITPPNMDITITGWIGYDNQFYYRTIKTSLPARGVTASQFLQHIREGNTKEAYNDVFQAYKVGRGVITVSNDNPEISINFSG